MLKSLVLVLLIGICHLRTNAEVPHKSLEQIRRLFYAGVEDEDKAAELLQLLTSAYTPLRLEQEPLLLAYYGSGITLIAKHSYNPYTKWNKLKEGLAVLERSIAKDKENLEIRFLRFSILHYLPGFLGFSSERNSDRDKLVELIRLGKYGNIGNKLSRGVINFLLESNRLSDTETAELKYRLQLLPE